MIQIRNQHLEERIDAKRQRRQKATLASTAEELLIERLTQIEITQREADAQSKQPAMA